MSAAEMMILLIVGIVVVGPKRLPEMMRKAGQYVAKLRRLSTDLRAQSGIDRILREEGLEKEIRELRALRESLSKHALFDSLVNAANKPAASTALAGRATSGGASKALPTAASANALKEGASETRSDTEARAETATVEGAEPTSEATTKPALATGSDNTVTTSKASELIRPAVGAVPRGAGAPGAVAKPANREPYRSFREREYPSYGPDHYDAFPDDLDETEDERDAAAAAGMTEPAVSEPIVPSSDPDARIAAKEGAP
ncbi:MAG: hypothetical protein HOW73_23600 [Polyangiaceae bacterium]|nr:hypothetical protein [Polyangiaceae bacterium]